MYNSGNSSKNVTGSSVVDGTLENADYADNAISGNKIDGGTISNFTSTGIDDNATSTAITIDASENVGIGHNAPSSKLHVKGIADRVLLGDTTAAENWLANQDLGAFAFRTHYNTTESAGMYAVGTLHGAGVNYVPDLQFKLSGTARLEVLAAYGNVKVSTGNLVIGGAGKGIDFSATSDGSGTMTSEVLDDYEEGTWTPVVADAASAGNLATSVHTGSYTKVGRVVTAHLKLLNIDTTGLTATNVLYVQGLPYVSGSIDAYGSAISHAILFTDFFTPTILPTVSSMFFTNVASNAGDTQLLVSAVGNSGVSDIQATITYQT